MPTGEPLYDRIGAGYSSSRREDPRIAAALRSALGDARTVLNVGAGTGAYEPRDLEVVALEPSPVMIAQRRRGSATVIEAAAERIPLEDDSVDAAMAVISDHHWVDRAAGLREMRRVARERVVLLNSDPAMCDLFWLTRDYLPGFRTLIPSRYRAHGSWARELEELMGASSFHVVPVPHDCADGFYQAFWRRPHRYLDATVRANISVFGRLPPGDVERCVGALRQDLEDGSWQERYASVAARDELDVGLRLVVAELA